MSGGQLTVQQYGVANMDRDELISEKRAYIHAKTSAKLCKSRQSMFEKGSVQYKSWGYSWSRFMRMAARHKKVLEDNGVNPLDSSFLF